MTKRRITGSALYAIVSELCRRDINGKREFIRSSLRDAGLSFTEQVFGQGTKRGINFVIKRKGKSGNAVVISAHYDGPGAYDNAGGVAVLFGVAGAMANRFPRHSVYLVFLDKEEIGQQGASYFLKDYRRGLEGCRESDKETMRLSVALDGCGIGKECVAVTNSGSWTLQIEGRPLEIPILADSLRFFRAGIPSLHCCSLPADELRQLKRTHAFPRLWSLLHTPHDEPSKVSPQALASNARWVLDLVDHALSHTVPEPNWDSVLSLRSVRATSTSASKLKH